MKPQHHKPQLHIVFNNAIPNTPDGDLQVIPKIIQHQNIHLAQRRIMLEKYRHYVQKYANSCPILNKEVLQYNAKVMAHVEQTKNHDYAKQVTDAFNEDFNKVSIQEYNHAVRLRNIELAQPLIKLKKFTPVKKSTEHVFSMILFKYAMQVTEKNNILKSCGATTTRGIQKIQINHYELANTVIDEVFTLPYCKRTIHNHINRLVEAGVLFDYTFKGREKPVEYHLNAQILTLFCLKKRKPFCAQNQLFTFSFEKELHNNDIDTRTYINKKEIIEPVNKQSRIKDTETLSGVLSKMQLSEKTDNNQNNNRNTIQRSNSEKEKHTSGANFGAKTQVDMASFLLKNIDDRQTLIEKFSHGHFKNWRFYENAPKKNPYALVTMQHLEYEQDYGIMLKADFLELLQQILFKMCGNIYRKSNKNGLFNYAGPSYKGYMQIETLLLNKNGTVPTKKVLLSTFKGLLWRIKFASNYYNSKSITPLFINEYLDPTRTTSKEGGFAYTLQFYKNHLELQHFSEKVIKTKQLQQEKAKVRKQKMKAIELVEKQINKLKNGQISIVKLHDYVSNNAHIPQSIKAKLPEYIQRAYSV